MRWQRRWDPWLIHWGAFSGPSRMATATANRSAILEFQVDDAMACARAWAARRSTMSWRRLISPGVIDRCRCATPTANSSTSFRESAATPESRRRQRNGTIVCSYADAGVATRVQARRRSWAVGWWCAFHASACVSRGKFVQCTLIKIGKYMIYHILFQLNDGKLTTSAQTG